MTLRHYLITACLFTLPAAQAATLLEIKSGGEVTRIYQEGSKSRMEIPGDKGYMVIDSAAISAHMVIPQERMVMDITDSLRNAPDTATDSGIIFSKEGSGPRIAGYKTTRYRYSAGKQNCGTLFTSRDAMEDTGLDKMLGIMNRMSAQSRAMMSMLKQKTDPCQDYSSSLGEQLKGIGAPLRVLDANGTVVSDVLRIDKKAQLPKNAFVIPSDYQVQNTHKMMQDLQKQMQNMPDMQKLMEQMQQQRR
ncbi:MAG TPA: DUF4412 domain-containing protein [Gammaproteobacteria bacterium]|nr:DUF4412 domain-containing protein [Gammaproteobacteria bacterium]